MISKSARRRKEQNDFNIDCGDQAGTLEMSITKQADRRTEADAFFRVYHIRKKYTVKNV